MGFTKGNSTTSALLTVTDNWHKALEEGSDVCAVFLDLSKAFDKHLWTSLPAFMLILMF